MSFIFLERARDLIFNNVTVTTEKKPLSITITGIV